jgi:hypothetical protein
VLSLKSMFVLSLKSVDFSVCIFFGVTCHMLNKLFRIQIYLHLFFHHSFLIIKFIMSNSFLGLGMRKNHIKSQTRKQNTEKSETHA